MRAKGERGDAGRQNYKDPAPGFSGKLVYEVLVAGEYAASAGRV